MSIRGCTELDDAWGPVLIAGLAGIAQATCNELAEAAGCPVSLVADIEAGRLQPHFETLERIANSVALEIRMGVRHRTVPSRVSDRLDRDFDRVREALATENDWRARLGLNPVGPPTAVMPKWDGSDPAPKREFNAWPNRTDFGGHSALNIRYGRSSVLGIERVWFARRTGLNLTQLADIESGHVSLRLNDTEALLNRAGLEQYAHIEPYDDHDDQLHLASLTRSGNTRPVLQAVRSSTA